MLLAAGGDQMGRHQEVRNRAVRSAAPNRFAARTGLQPAALFETVVATIANDDVVEYLHAEQRAGINEAASQLNVVRAGARIAAGMVVRLMCRRSLCGRGRWEPSITLVDTLISAT